jgi:Glycine zipper
MASKRAERETNRDPMTGEPGAHPFGTGAGAASGAAAGAAVGSAVGGPFGFAIGGAVGAIAGGLAGHGVAEAVNPTAEDAYWRENYSTRPYISADLDYAFYQPAYRYGWEARGRYDGRTWEEIEDELANGWYVVRGTSVLMWDDARPAARDAWDRVDSRGRIDSRR